MLYFNVLGCLSEVQSTVYIYRTWIRYIRIRYSVPEYHLGLILYEQKLYFGTLYLLNTVIYFYYKSCGTPYLFVIKLISKHINLHVRVL